ncbi:MULTISPECIES: hypothetical protein [unclassified Beijerinckia]|uniref:hypothetical protein n=1 Tax=unclassified Beijerinckia TaxID=2638183 RepID=UPI000B883843|nr:MULTISPECIES: hypothetical protein [unclassified Beijerinckia]MDH7799707.1 hypothetical protein [Beijerinckia sp. GAS462]
MLLSIIGSLFALVLTRGYVGGARRCLLCSATRALVGGVAFLIVGALLAAILPIHADAGRS